MPNQKKNYVVMDGNTAAAHVAYAFTEVAAIYPITPSSPMAEKVDEWSAKGRKNLFGSNVDVIQMQSEAGAAGTCHGSLQAGALTTTFTSSQGLMLMIPAMYAMGGQFLPSVMHIASRVVTSNHHSIFGDHTDFMTCRMTGYGMLMSSSPQEAMDLGAVAHLSAISAKYAFMHCFDGFRTSHEMQRIEALDYEDLRPLVDQEALKEFRRNALNPEHPTNRGNNVNPDVYFQCKEGANVKAAVVPATVQHYMDEINKITGRDYKLFNYYGAPDAEEVIVVMCSASEAVKETVDYLNAQGRKVGLVQIHLYRPFSVQHFSDAIPATVKKIAVLDRNKETGSVGEPVYLDVVTALNQAGRTDIKVVGGRYGLSSKDTTPGQFIAVYDNLKKDEPKNNFTIGINDDVTHTSLDYKEVELNHPGEVSCKLWGLGGDGTVGANKNAISTIGLVANKYAQAYFSYDSMKTGGLTQSHLRFGDEPIRSTYCVGSANFVAVHAPTYVNKYDTTEDLKEGGTFLLNCPWSVEELETRLPGKMKRDLANKHANFYIIDAAKCAVQVGLPANRTNSILQAAFFALTKVIPLDMAVEDMKKNNYNSYFKKAGQAIVDKNNAAVDLGINAAVKVEIPASWANAADTPVAEPKNATPFVKDIVLPMDKQKGDKLPVSVFQKHGVLDGTWENGTSVYSKRGVAIKVPKWNPESCIQCNACAMCCPHAAIRPVLLSDAEKAEVPASFVTVPAKGLGKDAPAYSFRMQVSPYDCLGCGVCLTACPANKSDKMADALVMTPFEEMKDEQPLFDDVAMNDKYLKKDIISDKDVKHIQFAKPYFQFSSACAGCAETTYIKLVSQLVGDRMYIGNAAGCSSAISGGAPILPYCKDCHGNGPAWEHSLFEDNAEFAYGFFHAQDAIRKELLIHLANLKNNGVAVDVISDYEANWQDSSKSRAVSDAVIAALESADKNADTEYVLDNKEYLTKKSVWAIGGDGWAYDIGFGGIDHVMAQNRDVNLLVLDTEVYSNTGGQSSKSTPTSATAKFAAGGKQVAKKDLGAILMQYGYVYVAQVAMGADQAQTLRALREAESYPGPSIVICYCPCLEQHIKAGMGCSQQEMKKAVECGYWHLYRYDPRRVAEGKNPFQLDSKEPDTSKVMDFLMGENRFASLKNNFPEKAAALYEKEVSDVKARYAKYVKMAQD
ncbi:pyruvate:ferredoxin (flavodoxin) oxidoreductase [Pseudoflavonifractor sp. MSJ-37]|uniref:pyruvate:ferredoxin (flavodoxin) oxidoreductase n=1 Tax=Pseudoflavonifractor sp. MSJ-37 TaxID=2841531 RepID=UPI001C11C96F|nr:pyruvate:ferredoxin (flavodoxin) oxidoreductase [Pseudoflavonifractor sp. MSJ-37]MBU5436357.1 pyruvate:ferredoxin (flavodoxin) oxidoreductase [Pseudoflavonifractor sp. MSJ-37]